jgi:hypothetical protein
VISLEAEMANLKNKCTKCGKELTFYRMVLMMGPKGYRRYAPCDRCAAKVEKGQKAEGKMQKAGA